MSASKQHAVLAEVFQTHLYVQPLEHMATIHLGIGLIITILNFIEQEKSLAKERRIFASHPRLVFFFPFSIKPNFGR